MGKSESILLPESVMDSILRFSERMAEDQAADEADSEQPRWEVESSLHNDTYGTYFVEFTDGEGWYKAGVWLDGCIHFYRYFNEPFGGGRDGNQNYLHIRDIDDMIARLQALKAAAIEHLGKAWPC